MKLADRVIKPAERPVAALLKKPAEPVYTKTETEQGVYTKHGKHKDAEAHKLKMREYMAKRRAAAKALKEASK